ncbi:hypothetical protein BZG01_19905 [Labilibaculum manganireducens]|uniref:Membrane fusion protein biotin-lipoyl like domain-containing protein n=1 Tax=Labilibaculum manganireducens TaxID=1940525 RepID=A0A2N3HSX8_9BACT|nr:HlyD family efflux transporter periplasmic adaptor subunit [Labilibaculum manganireducens]PKQ61164.1 hypothetical protein BZG01_19905 [Labilibaculum manganireducens]
METNLPKVNAQQSQNGANLMINKNSFAEHSNEIEEVISWKVPYIIRWGTVILFSILLFLGIICGLVKYPDVIKAPAELTSINAPKSVPALINGKIVKINAQEGQQVYKGDILGLMESTAIHEEVMKLSVIIDSIQVKLYDNECEEIPNIFQNHFSQLGELQASYQIFSQAFITFKNYLSTGFYMDKMSMLKKDMMHLKELHLNYSEQIVLQKEDLELAQKTMDAYELLIQKQIISDLVYRAEKSKFISKKIALPITGTEIINNENNQNNKQKEIKELENTISQQQIVFQQALNTFKSKIESWKKEYLLVAPLDGKISFESFIQENQQLTNNQVVCYVNPKESSYFAQITIPQKNFGKVELGQKVFLKFNSYPYAEFGSVIGKISFISHIPSEKGYLAKVNFINGLNTSYNKKVQYRDGLTANAEIITKDLSLIQRFYYSILQSINV